MKVALFYNKENIGDVLIMKSNDEIGTSIKKIDDLVVIYKNDEIIGYNYFNISHYFNDLKLGINYHPSNELISFINNKIKENNLEEIEIIEPNFRVGLVEECIDIEGTHLHLCKVNVKEEVLQIVCGAKNVEKGKLVVVAMIGTIMNDGSFINKGELKGYESYGMLCSKRELNIPTEEVRGLYLLNEEEYKIGDLFNVN
jgi:tRNA-binding protein